MHGIGRFTHGFRGASDNSQVGARGLVGFDAALFPIAQRANWNVVARREIFLANAERATDDLHLRGALHAGKIDPRPRSIMGRRSASTVFFCVIGRNGRLFIFDEVVIFLTLRRLSRRDYPDTAVPLGKISSQQRTFGSPGQDETVFAIVFTVIRPFDAEGSENLDRQFKATPCLA